MAEIYRHSAPVGTLGADVFTAWGFEQSVRWGDTIHYAGIAPFEGDLPDAVRCMHPGDLAGQLSHVLANLDAYLEADGIDRSKVLSWTIYVTDVPAFMEATPLMNEWTGEHRPAATLIGVAALAHPDQMIEITAFAAATGTG